jgi:hypothetical protein
MILVATTIVYRFPHLPKWIGYIGLFAAILGLWYFPFDALNRLTLPFKVVAVMVVCGIPMLFSGVVFALSFEGAMDRSRALSANLFGALVGGMLQVLSFLIGIKALLIVVAIFYGLALVAEGMLGETGELVPA